MTSILYSIRHLVVQDGAFGATTALQPALLLGDVRGLDAVVRAELLDRVER